MIAKIHTTLIALAFSSSACVYRFTNKAMRAPPGIGAVAIEAIYDTSREVIPHEHLWSELQRAFATSGKVRVTNQKDADALIRAHIHKAAGSQSGNIIIDNKRDPTFQRGKDPPVASLFRDMTVANRYADRISVSFSVKIEVWNLKTKKIIRENVYFGGASANSFRQTSGQHQYIMFEETIDSSYKSSMRSIAEQVVNDFYL